VIQRASSLDLSYKRKKPLISNRVTITSSESRVRCRSPPIALCSASRSVFRSGPAEPPWPMPCVPLARLYPSHPSVPPPLRQSSLRGPTRRTTLGPQGAQLPPRKRGSLPWLLLCICGSPAPDERRIVFSMKSPDEHVAAIASSIGTAGASELEFLANTPELSCKTPTEDNYERSPRITTRLVPTVADVLHGPRRSCDLSRSSLASSLGRASSTTLRLEASRTYRWQIRFLEEGALMAEIEMLGDEPWTGSREGGLFDGVAAPEQSFRAAHDSNADQPLVKARDAVDGCGAGASTYCHLSVPCGSANGDARHPRTRSGPA